MNTVLLILPCEFGPSP